MAVWLHRGAVEAHYLLQNADSLQLGQWVLKSGEGSFAEPHWCWATANYTNAHLTGYSHSPTASLTTSPGVSQSHHHAESREDASIDARI